MWDEAVVQSGQANLHFRGARSIELIRLWQKGL